MNFDENTPIIIETNIYATFIQRLIAFLIDMFLLRFPSSFIATAVCAVLGWSMYDKIAIAQALLSNPNKYSTELIISQVVPIYIVITISTIISGWLYYSICESSKWQATLGKLILGLRVVTIEGKRLSFLRASIRYFSRVLSNFSLGLGYLLCVLTPRNQTLHDLLAKTVVLKRIIRIKEQDL